MSAVMPWAESPDWFKECRRQGHTTMLLGADEFLCATCRHGETRTLTTEERIALARAPITCGILGTNYRLAQQPMAHAGCGERPSTPVFGASGRIVGSRAIRTSDGLGND